MARILTGIQSTGIPHLGNILGAVMPAIKMTQNPNNESFIFIADMHSLTQIKMVKNFVIIPIVLLQPGLPLD